MESKYRGLPIDPNRLPRHIGIVMDGNGRWATTRGLSRNEGHRAGSRAVRRVVRCCRSIGIQNLTLFAFSAQNWGRPKQEVEALMSLLGEFILKEWDEIMDKRIRVIHLGESRRIPKEVRERLRVLIQATRHHEAMTLALALSYGAREELIRATRMLCQRVQRGKLSPDAVDEEALGRALYTAKLPDPDLIIRTGGDLRLSNFLLWQAAYAELWFSPKLWPDFAAKDLLEAICEFQRRNRRLGLTDEQAIEREGSWASND